MQTDNKYKQVALLVHTCDRYEFLYKGFEIFFNQFWDHNIATNNYFATEEIIVDIKPFKNILSGKAEWSDRLIKILSDEIKEDYVLYMQEDMWLTKPVNGQFFKELFSYAISNSIDCIKLHSSEVYQTIPTGTDFCGLSLTKLNNEKSKYLMSHQVTLWKKEFLLKQLRKNEHPWRNERRATKRLKKTNPTIYHVDYFAENGKNEINKNINPSIRSEYFTVSVNGMLGENSKLFIDKLSKSNANPDYLSKLKYHCDNELTHDGKPKPRKEDFFQKIKRWIR